MIPHCLSFRRICVHPKENHEATSVKVRIDSKQRYRPQAPEYNSCTCKLKIYKCWNHNRTNFKIYIFY